MSLRHKASQNSVSTRDSTSGSESEILKKRTDKWRLVHYDEAPDYQKAKKPYILYGYRKIMHNPVDALKTIFMW